MALSGCAAPGTVHTTQPVTPAPSVDGKHLVRDALPADLSIEIALVGQGPAGFPDVSTWIENASKDEVVFTHGQGKLSIHVGQFSSTGSTSMFRSWRQLLAPGEAWMQDAPVGRWVETTATGEIELLRPTHLPPGRYDIWASFDVGTGRGTEIASSHQTFEVHDVSGTVETVP